MYFAGTLLDTDKGVHGFIRYIAPEGNFTANPVRAFLGYGLLAQFIAQLDLEFRSIQAALTAQTGDIEFPALLARLLCGKCLAGKNETQFIYALQLLTQFLVGIDGEGGGGDG